MQEYEQVYPAYYDCLELGQPGDVRFYVEEARRAGAPVLELGCGTGRTLIPVAQAGIDIVGLDRSPAMLSIARRNIASLSAETQRHVELVQGDMRSFYVEKRFSLVMIPNRSFLHLLTSEDQRQALTRIRDHLIDGGCLVFNIFDPRLEWIVEDYKFPGSPLRKHGEFVHPDTGNQVFVWATRQYDLEPQIIKEDFIFEEVDNQEKSVSRAYTSLTLRFVYRYEMQYLLELSGFKVENLYGNFQRGPFRYGGEQVWVARRS